MKRKLRYEDVYPVLYLKYRLETQQEDSGVRHLIVDEMQGLFHDPVSDHSETL